MAATRRTLAQRNGKPANKPRFDFYTICPQRATGIRTEIKQAAKQEGAEGELLPSVGYFRPPPEADNLKGAPRPPRT